MNYLILLLAFLCEFMDSSLGMGYGTTLTPLLMLLGYDAIEIVPCILISELCTGILSSILHHRAGNVNLKLNSSSLKIGIFIGIISIIGCSIAGLIVISISKQIINIIIGIIVFIMGIIILLTLNKRIKFSWYKIGIIGIIASFNKLISGGGYGPIVMSGQLFSGIKTKSAIGITSIAESITCVFGLLIYIIIGQIINIDILLYLLIGAMASVPFSVYIVKKLPEKRLKIGIGIFIILLGLFTLIKTIL